MPPGGHSLPESLLPGNGALHSSRSPLETTGYDGAGLSPISPSPISPSDADASLPFESPYLKSGDGNGPVNGGTTTTTTTTTGDGAQGTDGRVGRRPEPDPDGSRDPSSQRDPSAQRDRSTQRDRSRPNARPHTKSPSSAPRVCKTCGEALTGQFVRALGSTYHLECFKCEVGTHKVVYLPSHV